KRNLGGYMAKSPGPRETQKGQSPALDETRVSTPQRAGFFSRENIFSLVILIVCVLAIRWSVASPYHVPTPSMEPTIKVGDRLLANKLAYGLKIPFTDIELANWARPKRGDIIVFKFPENTDLDYVKRVVGIPGDKIEVRDDILYINGQEQPRTDH